MFFGKLKNNGDWGFFPLKDRFEKCIEIDDKAHMELIEKANSTGKLISGDKKGNPILVDPPKPTEEEIAKSKINQLELYLKETDWYVIRYSDSGIEIPKEVKSKRQEAREEISKLRESIKE
jgi:hypothetical protein